MWSQRLTASKANRREIGMQQHRTRGKAAVETEQPELGVLMLAPIAVKVAGDLDGDGDPLSF